MDNRKYYKTRLEAESKGEKGESIYFVADVGYYIIKSKRKSWRLVKHEMFETYKKIVYFFYEIFYAAGNAIVSTIWAIIPYLVLKSYGLDIGKKYYGGILLITYVGNYWYNYKKIRSIK